MTDRSPFEEHQAKENRPVQRPDVTAKPEIDSEMGRRHPLRILLAEDNAVN